MHWSPASTAICSSDAVSGMPAFTLPHAADTAYTTIPGSLDTSTSTSPDPLTIKASKSLQESSAIHPESSMEDTGAITLDDDNVREVRNHPHAIEPRTVLSLGHQPSSGRTLGQGHLGCSFTAYLFVSGRSGKPGSFAATDIYGDAPFSQGPFVTRDKITSGIHGYVKVAPAIAPGQNSPHLWQWQMDFLRRIREGSHQTHCFPLFPNGVLVPCFRWILP